MLITARDVIGLQRAEPLIRMDDGANIEVESTEVLFEQSVQFLVVID